MELVQQRDFVALAELTSEPERETDKIRFALWHSRACRALGQGERANSTLLKAIEGDFSCSAEELAEIAEELIEARFYEKAAILAEKLKFLGAIQAHYLWALLWIERENWEELNNSLSQLRSTNETIWNNLSVVLEARGAMKQGQLFNAKHLLSPFMGDGHIGIQKLLAKLYFEMGDLNKSKAILVKISEVQPFDWEWPSLLAFITVIQAQKNAVSLNSEIKEKISSLFKLGLERQPRNVEALYYFSKWELMQNKLKNAEIYSNQALKIKPWFNEPILMWAEYFVSKRNYEKALEIIQNSQKLLDTPKRSAAQLDLIRMIAKEPKDIIRLADKLLELYPNDISALRSAGAALQAVKKIDRARKVYEKCLFINPDDDAIKNNLAIMYRDEGELDRAIETWRTLNNRGLQIELNFAHTLVQQGNRSEARAIFTSILSDQPDNASALRGLAEIAFLEGDDQEAQLSAEASVRNDSTNPLAWNMLVGIIKRRKGTKAAFEIVKNGLNYAKPVAELRETFFHIAKSLISPKELENIVDGWRRSDRNEIKYCMMAADLAVANYNFELCERILKQALIIDKEKGSLSLIRFYLQRSNYSAALKLANELVLSDPSVMKYWGTLAEIHYQEENFEQAIAAVEKGLELQPTRLSLIRMKTNILLAQEQFEEAINTAKALYLSDQRISSLLLLSRTYLRAQRNTDAINVFESYLKNFPNDQTISTHLASALARDGRYEDAIIVLSKVFDKEQNNFSIMRMYCNLLRKNDQFELAQNILQRFAERNGNLPDVLISAIELMLSEKEFDLAENTINSALISFPENFDLWLLKANYFKKQLDAFGETVVWEHILDHFPPSRWANFAIADLVRVRLINKVQSKLNSWLKEEPDNPQPWWTAYYFAKEMKNYARALTHLDSIEKLIGKNEDILFQRADIYQETWQLGSAIQLLRECIEYNPSRPDFYETLLNVSVKAGDFDDFDKIMAKLQHMLGDRRYAHYRNFFFNINCHPSWDADTIWRFYQDWYERSVKQNFLPPRPHSNQPDPNRKLRIGYVSPDFRRHAVAYFSEPLLMHHDRNEFELYSYAQLDDGQADDYTTQFKTYFDHWVETRGMSDEELSIKIRDDKIDILVDLAGHTANNRLQVFLKKPAPIQVSWIGGAGQTTGLPQIDYILTDQNLVPNGFEKYFSEQVLRLPIDGLPYKPPVGVPAPTTLSCLSNNFVTFGVLARPLRINKEVIRVFAEILKRVPNSMLQFDHIPYVERDIQDRFNSMFEKHGIERERLIFANTRPHWNVYKEIDIQLDPFPAGSGTTATEGLFMERLVIAMRSRPPMGRAADSHLKALSLDKYCSADNSQEYIEKAATLANDTQMLIELTCDLRSRYERSSIMNYKRYGDECAKMYRSIWKRWCSSFQ